MGKVRSYGGRKVNLTMGAKWAVRLSLPLGAIKARVRVQWSSSIWRGSLFRSWAFLKGSSPQLHCVTLECSSQVGRRQLPILQPTNRRRE